MEWEDIIEAREPVRNSAFNLTAFNTGDESIMGFVFVVRAGGVNSVLNFCCVDWLGSILAMQPWLQPQRSVRTTKRNEPRRPEHTHLSPYRRRDERGTDACASNGGRVWTKAWSAIPSFQTSVRSRSPVPGFHRESNHGNETEGHAVRCEGWRGSGGRFCS